MYTKLVSHDGACHAILLEHIESLRRENIFASLTKIEWQEIILSYRVLNLFLFSLTSYRIKNHVCISAYYINNGTFLDFQELGLVSRKAR